MATDPRFGAAAPDQAKQRRHPASLADRLQRAQAELDVLLRDVHVGFRSVTAYHDGEERAQAIADTIVGAFRRPDTRPVNPPAWTSPDGRSAAW